MRYGQARARKESTQGMVQELKQSASSQDNKSGTQEVEEKQKTQIRLMVYTGFMKSH